VIKETIEKNPGLTANEIAVVVGLNIKNVYRHLCKMQDNGKVEARLKLNGNARPIRKFYLVKIIK